MRAIPSIRRPLVHLLVPSVMLLAACDTESLPTTPDGAEVLLAPATAAATDATLVADDQTIDTSGHAPLEVIQHEGSVCFLITFEGGGHFTQIHPETNGLVPGTPVRFPLEEGWVTLTSGPYANNPSEPTIAIYSAPNPAAITLEVPVNSASVFYASTVTVTLEAIDGNDNLLDSSSGPANFQPEGFTQWDPLGVDVGTDQITRVVVDGLTFGTGIDDLDVCIKSPTPLTLDLNPNRADNAVDPFSLNSKQSVVVAVLSTADVDATALDLTTVFLADPQIGLWTAVEGSTSEDIDGDGLTDLVLNFGLARDLGDAGVLDGNSTEIQVVGVVGNWWGTGSDDITIVGK